MKKAAPRPQDNQRAEKVEQLCRIIESTRENVSVRALAKAIGVSESQTHRMFKAATGVTPQQYGAECRRRRMTEALPRATSVTDAIFSSGFGSATQFYRESKKTLGMNPETYRRHGEAETIRFALAESSLGTVMVAATTRGVCAISLGDDPQMLLDELAERFASATLVGTTESFDELVAIVVGLVERPSTSADLPLDIQGTAFQQRVWAALRGLPPGLTIDYTQLAERLGMPRGARAVASACAANKLAIVVPCHRVVRRDGGLSGYRWGIERKAELLKRERDDNSG